MDDSFDLFSNLIKWVSFLFFWMLLANLVAGYAERKRLDRAAFFWFSFFFSPVIGWFIASLCAPKAEVESLKKCPDCAESIKFEAVVCRFCGRKCDPLQVPTLAAVVAGSTAPIMAQSSPGMLKSNASAAAICTAIAVVFAVVIYMVFVATH